VPRVVNIVGARPQFIKCFPVLRAGMAMNSQGASVEFDLLHTGQHYDHGMSKVFFEEMGMPEPDENLGIGSGSHGEQTGSMLARIEKYLLRNWPDWVVVYGDTNSTLAGALAAAKLHIPVAHVEAGLRSFNRGMPEEVNRVVADHLSELLFCPTAVAVRNLSAEGITKGVHAVGDVMYDALLHFGEAAEKHSKVLEDLSLAPDDYILVTLHRAANTDDERALRSIVTALGQAEDVRFVFPVHPRTKKAIEKAGIALPGNIRSTEPVGYLDMLQLEKNAEMIVTDSGGMQKEAYLFKVPCVTLRDETEWIETVEAGWNILVGTDTGRIVEAIATFKTNSDWPSFYGDGKAGEKIVSLLVEASR